MSDLPIRFTRRRKLKHWGATYNIEPAVLEEKFGDGNLLVWISPLNTRPDYYLVRVDSKWSSLNDDEWYDYLESTVYDAIADQFSTLERERENVAEDLREQGRHEEAKSVDLADWEERMGWPALDLSCGCAWGVEARLKGSRWFSRT